MRRSSLLTNKKLRKGAQLPMLVPERYPAALLPVSQRKKLLPGRRVPSFRHVSQPIGAGGWGGGGGAVTCLSDSLSVNKSGDFFFFFLAPPQGLWDPSSRTRDRTCVPCIRSMDS